MAAKPNIVFLLNDHQAYYRHGWDAGPAVRRPHFDRLAAGGITFSRAYTACPLCGPARRTILTGLFPHNHAEIHNDTNHPYDREVYLDILAASGYRCFYYGKWHAGAGTAHDHHCEGFSYPTYNNPYTKPRYRAYLQRRRLPEPQVLIHRIFWQREGMEVGRPWQQRGAWCNEHATGILQTPEDTHEAFFLANLACDKLRELAASDDDRPFALRVDFWGPHQPYFPTQTYADMYTPADIRQYGNFADTLEGKPSIYRYENNDPLHRDCQLIQPNPLPWSEWRKVLALCYAQITLVDAAGGKVLDALDELGFRQNTLVIWTTDHGDAVACHGGHFDKGAYMPEEMIRVPLAVRFPGRVEAPGVCDRLVSNLDVAPTLLDAAGLSFSSPVDGTSLLPLCRGEADRWRDSLLCETFGHHLPHVGRAIVTDRYKYVANRDDADELYDLRDDPFELHNLIHDPQHAGAITDLRAELVRWQRAAGDAADGPPAQQPPSGRQRL